MEKEIKLSDIQPICIALYDDEKWQNRLIEAKEYFSSQGLSPYYVNGIHAEKFGVTSSRPYDRDLPGSDWCLEPRTVGGYLSAYMVFNIAISHPEWEYILYIEDDTRFHDGWIHRAEQALKDVPNDFDWLFLSHCCTEGRETTHINSEIHLVKYPQAGHVSIIAKKALPILIESCRDACKPMDVHLFDEVFDKLKVYTLLPRLAEQKNTILPL